MHTVRIRPVLNAEDGNKDKQDGIFFSAKRLNTGKHLNMTLTGSIRRGFIVKEALGCKYIILDIVGTGMSPLSQRAFRSAVLSKQEAESA